MSRKTHYGAASDWRGWGTLGGGWVACGQHPAYVRLSTDPKKTTCVSCKRTTRWAVASAIAGDDDDGGEG